MPTSSLLEAEIPILTVIFIRMLDVLPPELYGAYIVPSWPSDVGIVYMQEETRLV